MYRKLLVITVALVLALSVAPARPKKLMPPSALK